MQQSFCTFLQAFYRCSSPWLYIWRPAPQVGLGLSDCAQSLSSLDGWMCCWSGLVYLVGEMFHCYKIPTQDDV